MRSLAGIVFCVAVRAGGANCPGARASRPHVSANSGAAGQGASTASSCQHRGLRKRTSRERRRPRRHRLRCAARMPAKAPAVPASATPRKARTAKERGRLARTSQSSRTSAGRARRTRFPGNIADRGDVRPRERRRPRRHLLLHSATLVPAGAPAVPGCTAADLRLRRPRGFATGGRAFRGRRRRRPAITNHGIASGPNQAESDATHRGARRGAAGSRAAACGGLPRLRRGALPSAGLWRALRARSACIAYAAACTCAP